MTYLVTDMKYADLEAFVFVDHQLCRPSVDAQSTEREKIQLPPLSAQQADHFISSSKRLALSYERLQLLLLKPLQPPVSRPPHSSPAERIGLHHTFACGHHLKEVFLQLLRDDLLA